MSPEDHSPVDQRTEQNHVTTGDASQEILSAQEPVTRGNTTNTDLINTQPLPAEPGRPRCDPLTPTCSRCGLKVADHGLLPPVGDQSQLQGSSVSVHSSSDSSSSIKGRKKKEKKNRSRVVSPHQLAATGSDSCVHLLLACLSCQCSALLLGLLDSASCCLHALCSSCCSACARCCAAVQETPAEELNCHAHCHSVLFESCCEPTECLEFCLECCDICHHS